MVNAETQTCASAQTPLWADEHFSFLELIRTPSTSAEEEDVQLPAKQRTWCKVRIPFHQSWCDHVSFERAQSSVIAQLFAAVCMSDRKVWLTCVSAHSVVAGVPKHVYQGREQCN